MPCRPLPATSWWRRRRCRRRRGRSPARRAASGRRRRGTRRGWPRPPPPRQRRSAPPLGRILPQPCWARIRTEPCLNFTWEVSWTGLNLCTFEGLYLSRSLKGAKLEYPVRNGEVLGGHVSLPERPHPLFPQHRRDGVKDSLKLGFCCCLDLRDVRQFWYICQDDD